MFLSFLFLLKKEKKEKKKFHSLKTGKNEKQKQSS